VLAIPVLSMPIAIGSSLGGAVCPRNAENRPNRPVGIRRANLAPTHPYLRSCGDWRSAAMLTTTMRNLRKRKCSGPRCCWHQGSKGRTGVRGLGARGPPRKTNAVLRTRFPASLKNWLPRSSGSQGIAKFLLMS
jgi:hypothetical protein